MAKKVEVTIRTRHYEGPHKDEFAVSVTIARQIAGPGDFGDSRHRAIYAAITGTGRQPNGVIGRFRAWLAMLPWRRDVRDMRAYMARLPGTCPDLGHLGQYAAIVREAAEERGAVTGTGEDPGDLDRLAGAAAWLTRQTTQITASRSRQQHAMPAAAATEPPAAPVRAGEMAAAARDTRRQITPGPAGGTRETAAQQVRPGAAPQRGAAAPVVAGHVVARDGDTARRELRAEDLQELVLADLLRRPDDARQVVGWLPAHAFTAGTHRATYDLIRGLVADGKPADPILVAWQARRARTASTDPSGLPEPEEILRIGALDAAPGTAAILGRALLADELCTRRFGKDWPALPLLTKPATTTGPAPGTGNQPRPDRAAVPVPEPGAAPGPDAAPEAAPVKVESPSARTPAGVIVRILQRILALTAAIWHNDRIGHDIKRSLIAYDH